MTGKSLHKSIPESSSLDEIQDVLAPLSASADRSTIFLDLDGTLAPIVPRPESVAVPPAIGKLIRKLTHMYMAVSVVSGRPATEAKRIVGNSDLTYIGNHGFETMLPGRAVVVSEEAQPFVAKIKELVEYCRSMEDMFQMGIMVEDKMATMSLHYRRSLDPEASRIFIEERIMPRVRELELKADQGRMVVEVKPPAPVNKGVSVGRLLDRLEATQAVYIGDDTTDIDALKELRRRKRKKNSIMIGVGVISPEMPKDLPKYADILVDRSSGVEMVLQLLAGEEL